MECVYAGVRGEGGGEEVVSIVWCGVCDREVGGREGGRGELISKGRRGVIISLLGSGLGLLCC